MSTPYPFASDTRSFYELLRMPVNASENAIKQAYKILEPQLHPDNKPVLMRELATQQFQLLQEAYATLSDPNKRKIYDRLLALGLETVARQTLPILEFILMKGLNFTHEETTQVKNICSENVIVITERDSITLITEKLGENLKGLQEVNKEFLLWLLFRCTTKTDIRRLIAAIGGVAEHVPVLQKYLHIEDCQKVIEYAESAKKSASLLLAERVLSLLTSDQTPLQEEPILSSKRSLEEPEIPAAKKGSLEKSQKRALWLQNEEDTKKTYQKLFDILSSLDLTPEEIQQVLQIITPDLAPKIAARIEQHLNELQEVKKETLYWFLCQGNNRSALGSLPAAISGVAMYVPTLQEYGLTLEKIQEIITNAEGPNSFIGVTKALATSLGELKARRGIIAPSSSLPTEPHPEADNCPSPITTASHCDFFTAKNLPPNGGYDHNTVSESKPGWDFKLYS